MKFTGGRRWVLKMKKDYKLNDNHKRNIAKRVLVLLLGIVFVSYMFKVFGSQIFNKFITNDWFIKISSYIDTIMWLNIVVYGLLGFVITLFTFCVTTNTLKLKWYEVLIILGFSILMSFFRYMWVGAITYLFDFIQYMFVPILYGCLTRKTNVLDNLMYTFLMYFATNGIMIVNMTLCDLKLIMYASNFVAYVLCFIEMYLFIVAFSIFIVKGGQKDVKSNIIVEQEERPTDRIQRH